MPGRGIVSRTLSCLISFLFTYIYCTAGHVTGPVLFLLYKVSLLGDSQFEARKRCCGLCSNCGLCIFLYQYYTRLWTADCGLCSAAATYCTLLRNSYYGLRRSISTCIKSGLLGS